MTILIILGTRPEGIKFAPLIKKLQSEREFDVKVCVTGQHKEMLQQVLDFFGIQPEFDLKLMRKNQDLYTLTSNVLLELKGVMDSVKPDLVFVQGDTTTAFIGGLAAFYSKVRVAHLEAGLRSGDRFSPFPEEVNRKLLSVVTDLHFAPTPKAANNLTSEGYCEGIYIVGNTVIDALLLGLDTIKKTNEKEIAAKFPFLNEGKRTILVTSHRRESFGDPFERICESLLTIVNNNEDVNIVYPVHLNPNVQEVVYRVLNGHPRINLISPLDYPSLIWLMSQVFLVVTDSGGIQEEAPSLGKPVVVLREVTERVEGIESGTAILVGTDKNLIVDTVQSLLDNRDNVYDKMAKAVNPYGDGTTSNQITNILKTLK
tara:strand:+ start:5843 stop:6958 length:1116 start_codon:yes stop_codon:yes gene_type:complete